MCFVYSHFSFFSGSVSDPAILYKKPKQSSLPIRVRTFTTNLFYLLLPVGGAKSSSICLRVFEIPREGNPCKTMSMLEAQGLFCKGCSKVQDLVLKKNPSWRRKVPPLLPKLCKEPVLSGN